MHATNPRQDSRSNFDPRDRSKARSYPNLSIQPKFRPHAAAIEKLTELQVQAIARAEVEHRIRVPANYGLTPADAGYLKRGFDEAVAQHAETVRGRKR